MTDGHQLLAIGAVALTALLAVVAAWSAIAGRRSAGRVDHRFAVDRVVLAVLIALVVNAALGVVLLATGLRPKDALHLLYAIAAPLTLVAAWWLGGRPDRHGHVTRLRRDGWVLVAGLILVGLEARLFMTGG